MRSDFQVGDWVFIKPGAINEVFVAKPYKIIYRGLHAVQVKGLERWLIPMKYLTKEHPFQTKVRLTRDQLLPKPEADE
ncbi:hypothetical protein CLV58_11930 [Spirosoma oryzae]|uniref:Uncharacterized protein n=1 Tax=Spirosoma oryzae TaxID=1469603 RepID=A0A2T0SKE5_9BACT|nr:hypothetical protein CLV58_11930 [Spirosoma oryzae]